MTNSIELMAERFARLPEDSQKAIRQFAYDDALKGLHTVHKLHIDQAYSLEQIVADVIFGDTESGHLTDRIEKDLRIPRERAQAITMDINKNIFLPIQANMKILEAKEESAV